VRTKNSVRTTRCKRKVFHLSLRAGALLGRALLRLPTGIFYAQGVKQMSSSSTANPPAKHPGQLLRQRLLRCRGGVDGREREGRNRKNRTCQAVLHRAPPHVAEPDVGDHLLQQLRRSKATGNGHAQIRRSSSLSTSMPVRRTFGRLSTRCCPCA
jgi:hypothetical protein